jgi:hypothetical protein
MDRIIDGVTIVSNIMTAEKSAELLTVIHELTVSEMSGVIAAVQNGDIVLAAHLLRVSSADLAWLTVTAAEDIALEIAALLA